MLLNEGQAKWISNKAVEPDTVHFYISFAAPYLELIEEMTAREFLYFHSRLKNFIEKFSASEILDRAGLIHAADKQIRYFSSGMKQRLKLAQAIFSDVPVILLDEPCTNLDVSGFNVYYDWINEFCKERLLIVSSNDVNEYKFCDEQLKIQNFKTQVPH